MSNNFLTMDKSSNLSQESALMDLTPTETRKDEHPESNSTNCDKEDEPPKYYGQNGNLRSVKELPKKFQHIFNFPYFNIIQSSMLDDVLYSDVPVVVSAPTGSGKTVIFELAVIRLLRQMAMGNFSEEYKIIYVAPIKALCAERLQDWHHKFAELGISCVVMTGDSDIIEWKQLKTHQVILTTPEKLDSVTRSATEATAFIQTIKLLMIDEVHLLNEESRGPTLEAVVSRIRLLKAHTTIRFIAVSATIPNVEDIAEWLSDKESNAMYYKIGESLRPVKLKKIVLGYPCPPKTPAFKFDISLNYKLPSVLMQFSEGKPTLVFCTTRKGVEITSKHLSQSLTFHLSSVQREQLAEAATTMLDNKMRSLLLSGVGVHHAGMSLENRGTVERLFRDSALPVLVATSTLAMGVNLPAHLVVIKSTQQYINGSYQNYSESSLLQMIGRAGRPQFDTHATVVIMTKSSEKEHFEKMVGGTQLIESNLHRHLTQYLNAEIVLQVITDIAVALDWLRSTFLYVRVLKNPKHYNMPTNVGKEKIEKKLQDLCQIEINALSRYGMLEIDQEDGFSVRPTNNGILMANYYLAIDTMKLFLTIKGTESLPDILQMICNCSEFSEITLRVDDKRTLNTLNSCKFANTIRFPLPGTIKTRAMKANCIIQATFGCLKIHDPSLYQEALKIMRTGERICKALVAYLLPKEKCFSALLNALILSQCFHAQLWENSVYVSKQLNKIGVVLSSMLAAAGKTTFKSLLETNPRDIERIINRSPPMGNDIHNAVAHLPFYRLELKALKNGEHRLEVLVKLLNPDAIRSHCTVVSVSSMMLVVGDSKNNVLFCKKIQHNTMILSKERLFTVDLVIFGAHVVQAHLISENWVGLDCHENVEIIVKDKLIATNSTMYNQEIEKHDVAYNSYGCPAVENRVEKKPERQNTILKYLTKPSVEVARANVPEVLEDYTAAEPLNIDEYPSLNCNEFVSKMEEDEVPNKTNNCATGLSKPATTLAEEKLYPFQYEIEEDEPNLVQLRAKYKDPLNEYLNTAALYLDGGDFLQACEASSPGTEETQPNNHKLDLAKSAATFAEDKLYPFEYEIEDEPNLVQPYSKYKDPLNEYLNTAALNLDGDDFLQTCKVSSLGAEETQPNNHIPDLAKSAATFAEKKLYPFKYEIEEDEPNLVPPCSKYKDPLNEYLNTAILNLDSGDFLQYCKASSPGAEETHPHNHIPDDENDLDMINCLEQIETIENARNIDAEKEIKLLSPTIDIRHEDDTKTKDNFSTMPRSFKEYVHKKIMEINNKQIWKNSLCDFDIGIEDFIMDVFENNSENKSLNNDSEETQIEPTVEQNNNYVFNNQEPISLPRAQTNDTLIESKITEELPVQEPSTKLLNSLFSLETIENLKNQRNAICNEATEITEMSRHSVPTNQPNQFDLNIEKNTFLPRQFFVDHAYNENQHEILKSSREDTLASKSKASPIQSMHIHDACLQDIENELSLSNSQSSEEIIETVDTSSSLVETSLSGVNAVFPRGFYVKSPDVYSRFRSDENMVEKRSSIDNGVVLNPFAVNIFGNISRNPRVLPFGGVRNEISLSSDSQLDVEALENAEMERNSVEPINTNPFTGKAKILPSEFYAEATSFYNDNARELSTNHAMPDRNVLKARLENVLEKSKKIYPALRKNENKFESGNITNINCDKSPLREQNNTQSYAKSSISGAIVNEKSPEKRKDLKKFLRSFEFRRSPVKKLEPSIKKFTSWRPPIRTISGNYKNKCKIPNKHIFKGNIKCTSYSCFVKSNQVPKEKIQMSMVTIVEKQEAQRSEENKMQTSFKYNTNDDENTTGGTFVEPNELPSSTLKPPTFSLPDFQYQPFDLKKLSTCSFSKK